jgi:hypothetical protein
MQLILHSLPYFTSYYWRLSTGVHLSIKTIDPYIKGIEEDFMYMTFWYGSAIASCQADFSHLRSNRFN